MEPADEMLLSGKGRESGLERGAGAGAGAGRRGRGLGLALLLGVAAAVGLALLGAEVHRAGQAAGLRAEMDALRRDVDQLRHRLLEEELLSDLKHFTDQDYEEGEEGDEGEEEDDSSASGDHHARHYNTDPARRKRNVAVPVIAGSYGGPANRTEGLRLYESLVAGGHDASVLRSTSEHTPNRVSTVRPSKQHRKKYNQAHAVTPAVTLEGGASSGLISRPSRVMNTDKDPSRRVTGQTQPAQQLRDRTTSTPGGEILFRVYQEQRAVPESTVRSVELGGGRRRRKQRPGPRSSVEGVEERPAASARHRLLPAAHFNGDTTHYTQAHEHYDGNGRLRHPDGVFTDWSPSKWVQQLGMDRHFRYEAGAVTIKDTGLYLVYAQIHYLDEHDINGYRVYVNEDPMLQCTTMTHSMGRDRVKKSNTCFTAAALFLTENDRLSLSDIGGLRYSLFEPAKSFFGLIKLGSVNIK